MIPVLRLFDAAMVVLRPLLFWVAAMLAVVALVDWLVRTRRISPFSGVARFTRRTVDPIVRPVEQRLVRAGGNPQMAPFWTLAAVVLGGIVLLALLGFVRDQIALLAYAAQGGPRQMTIALIQLMLGLLRIALIVRVVSSWIGASPYRRGVRWAFTLTEPLLRPLRQVIPPLGMIDITPLVAWFAIDLLGWLVMSSLR